MKNLWKSLRFRMLLPALITVVGVTFLLTFLVSRNYSHTLLREEDAKAASSFAIIDSAINERLTDIRASAMQTSLSADVADYALQKYGNRREQILTRIRLLSTLNGTLNRQPALHGLLIMRPDGTVFGRLPYRTVFYDNEPLFDKSLLQRILEVPSGTVACFGPFAGREIAGHEKSLEYYVQMPDKMVLDVQKISYTGRNLCYVIDVYDAQSFMPYLELLADSESTVSLTNTRGELICSTGNITKTAYDGTEETARIVANEAGQRVYLLTRAVSGTDWVLVKEIPTENYDRTVRAMRRTVWTMALGILAFAVLLYLRWLKGFMRTFNALRGGIRSMGQGHVGTQIDQEFPIREFEDIRTDFNEMNRSLIRTMEENSVMEREKLELTMRNLQTQLSPHMIFNSITAIRWIAMMLGADQVSDMLTELSEMLRPVLREWRLQWTVREELEHLRHYTRLLDIRFASHFRLECEVREDLLEEQLPRFTLQPLVENACEHGGIPEEELLVRIDLHREGQGLRLNVYNNGQGITDENIARVREMLKSGQQSENIGLYNVYSRLAICMGQSAILDILRPEGGGTLVTAWWPTQTS